MSAPVVDPVSLLPPCIVCRLPSVAREWVSGMGVPTCAEHRAAWLASGEFTRCWAVLSDASLPSEEKERRATVAASDWVDRIRSESREHSGAVG